ncbi:MAG: hypothetical protein ACOCYP_09490 [Planctomycetota bacterium]
MQQDEPAVAHWQGELLWPCDLRAALVIDMSGVACVGAWTHAWFRRHPRQAVVGATRCVRQQLQRAELPILWYATAAEALDPAGGVTPTEREMLWE